MKDRRTNKKNRALILALLILSIFGIIIFKGCRYDWSPHYIDNDAVTINEKLFSPDSSVTVVFHTLDVGARGDKLYKSLLRSNDYGGKLTTYNLPPEIVIVNWEDNQTLKVTYDPNEIRLGGTHTNLDLTKDTINVNGINLIVTERKTREK